MTNQKGKTWKVAIFAAFFAIFFLRGTAHAATNINASSTSHWAWNDIVGWIDFYNTDSVMVSSQQVTGFASSPAGNIYLSCNGSNDPAGCGAINFGVINDGNGNLEGWGWNDAYGWISFCGGQGQSSMCPGSITYQVEISGATGDFSGFAWNDLIGWISFCGGQSTLTCPGSIAYKVNTSWRAAAKTMFLDSSTFDTGVPGGAQLNSVLWQGYLPGDGAAVHFQFSASNSSIGPWNFTGPDGTENSDYGPVSANTSFSLTNYTLYNNKRYFRYRAVLISNAAQTASPRVDDIIINWSP